MVKSKISFMYTKRKTFGASSFSPALTRRKTGGTLQIVRGKRKGTRSYTNKKLNTGHKGQEVKHFDNFQTVASISTTGAQIGVDIFDVQQGLTDTTRIGRKITVSKFQWRYRVTLPIDVAGGSETVRCIIGVDHQCNGAVSAVLDIFETVSLNSYYNLANSDRFTVFWDRWHVLVRPAGGPLTATTVTWAEPNIFVKGSKTMSLDVEFDASAGAVTDLTSNNFFFFIIS